MRTRIIACAAFLAIAGCRGNGNQELLERDLRWQEDQIYCLTHQLDQAQDMLDASRQENDRLKHESAGGSKTPSGGPPAGPVTPPTIEIPPIPGTGAPPSDAVPAPPSPGGASSILHQSSSADEVTDTKVTQIVLNKQLTGGFARDGRPGSDGVLVVFEPRNAAGQLVEAPGEVSIAVLQPGEQGPAARIARWDFTTDQVASHYHRGHFGQGYQLECFWPGTPPTVGTLRLALRYITPQGEKLMASTEIRVKPSSPSAGAQPRQLPTSTAEGSASGGETPSSSPAGARSTRRPSWRPNR